MLLNKNHETLDKNLPFGHLSAPSMTHVLSRWAVRDTFGQNPMARGETDETNKDDLKHRPNRHGVHRVR